MSVTLPATLTSINLVFDWSSSSTRLVFHIYLGIVSIAIGLIGDRCCANRARLSLMRDRRLQLTHMTGWLSHFDVFKAIWSLKALPAGWIGLFMVVAVLLSWADILIVATLIRTEAVHDRCPFGTGMVISTAAPAPDGDITTKVSYNGAPSIVAAQAQVVSVVNGGLPGVYKKVNRSLNFSATPEDVLGAWECTPLADELVFPYTTSLDGIVSSLESAGLTYPLGAEIFPCYSDYPNERTGHLVWLDSSTAAEGFTEFDVRVSFDLTAGNLESKMMKTFECKANSAEVGGIMQQIYSEETLANWCQTLQGALYDGTGTPASSQAQKIIESTLNTILMVAGGNNYLLDDSAANDTQGCLAGRTTISWAVFALAGVTTVFFLGTIFYWLVLLWLIMSAKSQNDKARRNPNRPDLHATAIESNEDSIKNDTPGNVYQWMAQATRESKGRRADGTKVKIENLKTLYYGRTDSIPAFGVLEDMMFPGKRRALNSNSYSGVESDDHEEV